MTFLSQVGRYVRGEKIENPHPAIQVFGMCAALNWTHLPVAGGLYDQDPELLEKFREIWSAQHEHEKREADKRKRDSDRKAGARGIRRRGR